MPLYEYRCESCDHQFEILRKIGQGAEGLACPQCGDEGLAKQFSTFAATDAKSVGSPMPAGGCCRGTFT